MLVAFLSYLRSIIRSHSQSPIRGQPSDYQHPKLRGNRNTCPCKRSSWPPAKRAADIGVIAAVDVVDGARSRQRGPIRVIVVSESHQGATPCKLQRSVWI